MGQDYLAVKATSYCGNDSSYHHNDNIHDYDFVAGFVVPMDFGLYSKSIVPSLKGRI